jgi:hypothetical protein
MVITRHERGVSSVDMSEKRIDVDALMLLQKALIDDEVFTQVEVRRKLVLVGRESTYGKAFTALVPIVQALKKYLTVRIIADDMWDEQLAKIARSADRDYTVIMVPDVALAERDRRIRHIVFDPIIPQHVSAFPALIKALCARVCGDMQMFLDVQNIPFLTYQVPFFTMNIEVISQLISDELAQSVQQKMISSAA